MVINETTNQRRHYDERSEEAICFKLFKFLTDSFVALAMTFSNFLRAPLNPLKGKTQRAASIGHEPRADFSPLGELKRVRRQLKCNPKANSQSLISKIHSL